MSAIAAAVPRKAAAPRSNAVLYTVLAVLFLVAGLYYVHCLAFRFPQWFGVNRAAWPVLLGTEDKPNFQLLLLFSNAQAVGLRDGDLLIAINGVPVTSRSIYSDALAASHPGKRWTSRFNEVKSKFMPA